MNIPTELLVISAVVILSLIGSAIGFSIGYYRMKRRMDTEVRYVI